ncbi:MAG: class I SAM-dependent methyltransferase [Cyclobacteriaceae bacterium]
MKYVKNVIRFLERIAWAFDLLVVPLTIVSGCSFRIMKFLGIKKFPINRWIFHNIGFFPVVSHYYEPQFDFRSYSQRIRNVKGVNFNPEGQLGILRSFRYGAELTAKPADKGSVDTYFFNNGSFESGDSECYYSIIRKFKPRKIIEIGSGYSTLIALEAIDLNRREDKGYDCVMTCIEPYEMNWLKAFRVELLSKKVEEVDLGLFETLDEGDILFIDSSHMMRPQGDVLFEIFEILPVLKSGVLIHFHDIFSPLDYPENWLKEEFRMWNEQYLVEAFLWNNDKYRIMLALSYLSIHYVEELCEAFPVYCRNTKRSLASLWLQKA